MYVTLFHVLCRKQLLFTNFILICTTCLKKNDSSLYRMYYIIELNQTYYTVLFQASSYSSCVEEEMLCDRVPEAHPFDFVDAPTKSRDVSNNNSRTSSITSQQSKKLPTDQSIPSSHTPFSPPAAGKSGRSDTITEVVSPDGGLTYITSEMSTVCKILTDDVSVPADSMTMTEGLPDTLDSPLPGSNKVQKQIETGEPTQKRCVIQKVPKISLPE